MCQTCIDEGRISCWLMDVMDEVSGRYHDADSGFAHIVLGDYNVNDHHINYCLTEALGEVRPSEDDADVAAFLRWLLTVSKSERGGV